tara:strand:+ start:1565 stop:2296 length:732 start_codon:yes stop_codon:yes gene_type:complete
MNYCIANWKMNKNFTESEDFINTLRNESFSPNTKAIICPPSIFLKDMIDKAKNIELEIGAQNFFHKEVGAFTGEISSSMLKSIDCNYSIVGHSERREYFKERNSDICCKISLALKSEIKPVLCIGESLEVREKGKTFNFLSSQLSKSLNDIDKSSPFLLAYEPIWAIGTGNVPSTKEISEIFNFIDKYLKNSLNIDVKIPLIYGGSVSPDNAKDIISVDLVSGFLIGGSSLDVESYISIYKQM